jgi:hypothetical protein
MDDGTAVEAIQRHRRELRLHILRHFLASSGFVERLAESENSYSLRTGACPVPNTDLFHRK